MTAQFLTAQFLAAALGTVAFALIFGVPRKYYPYSALIGGSGWLLYCLLNPPMGPTVATFLSTVLVILLSRVSAVHWKCPVTIFLVAGIIPLVPGAGIYWSAYYMVTDQLTEAGSAGLAALKAAMAIVLGIVFVFELPQGFFRLACKKDAARQRHF